MGSQMLLESEMGSSDNNNNNNMWSPGSPRLSFSRDFVQSEVFNPSNTTTTTDSGDSDFDFGMFALLRGGGEPPITGSSTPMLLPSQELIHNGKILLHPLHQSSDHSHAPKSPHKLPKSPPSRSWKDLFPLNFMRSSSSSASSSSSTSPGEKTPSASSSKLRFLFRSSSAGSGAREQEEAVQEPCLGRSASESNVSSTSCDPFPLDRKAPRVCHHRRSGSSTADALTGKIPSGKQRSRHRSFNGRPVLAEVKVAARVDDSPGNCSPNLHRFITRGATSSCSFGSSASLNNNNKLNNLNNLNNNRSGKSSSSSNALRAYVSSGSRSTGNMKVAEVLHMEVCMGQSISKAFSMRKENEIHAPKHSRSSSSSSSRLPRRVLCHSEHI